MAHCDIAPRCAEGANCDSGFIATSLADWFEPDCLSSLTRTGGPSRSPVAAPPPAKQAQQASASDRSPTDGRGAGSIGQWGNVALGHSLFSRHAWPVACQRMSPRTGAEFLTGLTSLGSFCPQSLGECALRARTLRPISLRRIRTTSGAPRSVDRHAIFDRCPQTDARRELQYPHSVRTRPLH